MNANQHYQEAEAILNGLQSAAAGGRSYLPGYGAAEQIGIAQVHATLALAAWTEQIVPVES